jgi:hypothetical protein
MIASGSQFAGARLPGMYSEVTNSPALGGFTNFGAPAINDLGDIAFRANTPPAAGLYHALIYQHSLTPGVPGNFDYNVLPLAGGEIVFSPLISINNSRSIAASIREIDPNKGVVLRYDYAGGVYSASDVARWDTANGILRTFNQTSPLSSISDNGQVAFWNRATPSFTSESEGIYRSESLTNAAASHFATVSGGGGLTAIDQFYVDNSNAGIVFRGSAGAGTGIYVASSPETLQPIATPSQGFADVGARPSINNAGNVAFSGTAGPTSSVFVGFAAGGYVDTASNGVRSAAVFSTNKIAINDFNQVAYLGTNSSGNTALFSNNLGANREILAVGDRLFANDPSSTVTGIALWEGLNDSGQIAMAVRTENTALGAQIVIAQRGYTQNVLNNIAATEIGAVVPWAGQPYLLNSNPPVGYSPTGTTIADSGCNLVSMTNILSYYGAAANPQDFQNWLVERYYAPAHGLSSRYITDRGVNRNDFSNAIIGEYSEHLVATGKASKAIYANGVIRTNELEGIVGELQAGRPVKIQVPGRPGGTGTHFIIAYGLVDPTKSSFDQIDILIFDPGHGSYVRSGTRRTFNTLADYSEFIGGTDWLTDATDRVFRYSTDATHPLILELHSPANMLLTDPLGNRVGIDSLGQIFEELLGSQYYEEEPFTLLDSDIPVGEVTKNVLIPQLVPGNYTLELFGTGTGFYSISDFGALISFLDPTLLEGMITPGQHITLSFRVVPEPSTWALAFAASVCLTVARLRVRGRAQKAKSTN